MWLASIFGPYLTILGLWMLLYNENLVKIVASIKSTPSVFYITGLFNLIVGLAIISQYNMWVWNITFFVTLLGWLMILRGILILFIPQLVIKTTMTNLTFVKIMGLIPFLWGVILCGLAFLR